MLLVCLFFLIGGTDSAFSAYPSQEFKQGWRDFHRLLDNPRKAKYRSHWYAVKDHFQRAYTQSPKGSYAPKSLFYLGRVYDEMSKISMLKSDALKAVDYYTRVVLRFPDHSWADDALFRRAQVEMNQLKDKDQAYLSLLSIVHKYPKGDMAPKAKKMLEKLDKTNRKTVRASSSKSASKSALSSAPSTSRTPAKKTVSRSSHASPKPGTQTAAHLVRVRHWSSKDYTRVVLDLDEQTGFYNHLLKPDSSLKTPHRLFVDLKNTGVGREIATEQHVADGILRSIRVGRHSKEDARVVLDIDSIDNFRVFSLSNPFRVVIDVYGDKTGGTKPSPADTRSASTSNTTIVSQNAQSKSVARSLVEQLGLKIKTIMVDPGHGGKDPGAVANKIREKDINLKMAKILGKKLEKKGFKVLYTRTTDVFVPLEERTAMANARDADLFISVHCNACPDKRAHGLELYYLNLAKSRDAVRVAARENAVSVKKISDLQVILTDLMLNSKITESRDLAKDIHTKSLNKVRTKYKVNDHGVKGAPFYVLMGSKMPAVLAELGYITNAAEAKRLRSTAYLDRLAEGMVQGVLAYQRRIEGLAGL
ncbi:N-acetylmuramoyl-L-alanine amidase [Desulfoplanes formicivorans]|uniref:N-acetylmuramoyl-L-alanine amidase n=2 Tax=Desulfoplanes formicivorans TaxID=1592317 RepID=A0A194AJ03_9BACT|nr:N-acetylmuramoyl-L-alanine amidase [Desulfoplanes formicivorans]